VAVNHDLEPHKRNEVIHEARAILRKSDTAVLGAHVPSSIWQAKDWALAALGHLGDLNTEEIVGWFSAQADNPVLGHSQNAPESANTLPSVWWFLMIAFT